jgi:hypothetical protein
MTMDELARAQPGWDVVGNDGGKIGTLQEVHDDHLVVEHGLINKQQLYVPVSVVDGVRDEAVALSIPAGQADEMGWHVPAGTTQGAGPAPLRSGGSDTTAMTGAGYGAGGTVASAGPFSTTRGDQIHDRLGGSGRAGLGRAGPPPEDDDDAAVSDEPTSAPRNEQQREDAR